MQKQLVIAENIFEPDSWIRLETDDVCRSLMEHFGEWPENARLYNGQVAVSNDITPVTDSEVERIGTLDGPFYAVISPKNLPVYIAIAIVAMVAVVAFMPKPKIPITTSRENPNPSPNNDLSERANKPRINGRIPDIFGTEIAIPDLLAVPYSVFVDDVEHIHDFMCVGRGHYEILPSDIKDAETRLLQIQGASAEIYPPFTSPNFGASQLRIGNPKLEDDGTDPLKRFIGAVRSKSVNGQTLYAPNDSADREDFKDSIRFVAPNKVVSVRAGVVFDALFGKPNLLIMTRNHRNCDGCYMFNFSGTYSIQSITSTEIVLNNPASVSDSWNRLFIEQASKNNYNGAYGIPGHSVGLASTESTANWVGPFAVDNPEATSFIANFIAQNGLYTDDGTTQTAVEVDVEIGILPMGVTGLPSGSESFYQVTLKGSDVKRSQVAKTLGPMNTQFKGRFLARARRLTPRITEFQGQVSDEIKWRNLYGAWPITQQDFGDITTVRSITVATPTATAIQDRELNMLVKRKIPRRISGSTFTTELFPSNSAADIFCAIAFDKKIGNRSVAEVDVGQIYSTITEVAEYFGTSQAAQFCYTFDNDNITPEETMATVARAVFCEAYRRGKTIKLTFERDDSDPVLLFNHRNKVPKSEKRTITFGPAEDHDGIEYEYISPADGSLITLHLPTDQSAVNPKKIESIGVRNHRQAHFHAWRLYNRIFHQHVLAEFEGLQESNIIMRNDRILLADNTTVKTRDGEVVAQDVMQLTLSQKHGMEANKSYAIYLQHIDASVQMIPITIGSDDYSVILNQAPTLPLCVDEEASVRAGYMIFDTAEEEPSEFIVVERDPNDNFTSDVKAINYSPFYYANDKDYLKGLLPAPPEEVEEPVSGGGGTPNPASYQVVLTDNWAVGSLRFPTFSDRGYVLFQNNGVLKLANAYIEAGAEYPSQQWLKQQPAAIDVTGLFEIRATFVSGTKTSYHTEDFGQAYPTDELPQGPAMDTWLPLDVAREWWYGEAVRSFPFGDTAHNAIEGRIRFEIRRIGVDIILASAVISMGFTNPPDPGNTGGT